MENQITLSGEAQQSDTKRHKLLGDKPTNYWKVLSRFIFYNQSHNVRTLKEFTGLHKNTIFTMLHNLLEDNLIAENIYKSGKTASVKWYHITEKGISTWNEINGISVTKE